MHTLEKSSKHNLKLKRHHMISVLRIYPEIYKVRKLHVHKVASMDLEMMSIRRILHLSYSFFTGQNHILKASWTKYIYVGLCKKHGMIRKNHICKRTSQLLMDTLRKDDQSTTLNSRKHHKISVHRIYPEIYKVRKLLHVHKVANMDPMACCIEKPCSYTILWLDKTTR